MLAKDRYVASFTADASTLLDLAARFPDRPIVHCGEWRAVDLVAHIGGVWDFMRRHVTARSAERVGKMAPPDLTGDELFEWCRQVAADLGLALAGVRPEDPVWSWTGDATGGFYLRRAAQETAMHLWDLRNASGAPRSIDEDLAVDGVDELIDTTYPNLLARGLPVPTGSLHLHRSDGDGEWTAQIVQGELVTTRAHAKGDAAVRGTACDLLLALWERVALDDRRLSVFGDVEVARTWTALTR